MAMPFCVWRVHILPYVGEEKLYNAFQLKEGWDSETNKKLISRMPQVFQGPNDQLNADGRTIFQVPVGVGTAFPPDGRAVKFPGDFKDGTSNTVLLIVADDERAVVWTKPDDLSFDVKTPRTGLRTSPYNEILVSMADGSWHQFPSTIRDKNLGGSFLLVSGSGGVRRSE